MSARGATLPPAAAGAQASIRRSERALWAVVGIAIVASIAATTRDIQPVFVLAAFVLPLTAVAFQRTLLSWHTLLGVILAVILFVPIRRYTVGGGGPVELEPYRILIAVVLGSWLLALAADPDVRWRATGYGKPIAFLWIGILASLALNIGRVNSVSGEVIKEVTFFASYFLVLVFVVSVVRRGPQLDRMLKLLVAGGAIVAACGLYEWRSGRNLFNGLGSVLPFLHYQDIGEAMVRGTGVRALASAQHPIALGAALVILIPLAIYLYKRTRSPIWLAFAGAITLGAFSTGSRTAALMMVVVLITFLVLKRGEVVRLLPHLLVLVAVVQVVMPGTLGSFRAVLNPSYVVKEQSAEMGTGSGRLHDLGPSLDEWAHGNAFVGAGFGTRITTVEGVEGGAQILDNQWLTTLLETGAIGVLALLWLFCRAIRRLGRVARAGTGSDSWLATCLAASLSAFAVGLVTYDAFSFIQVTFLAFVLLGFAAVVTLPGAQDEARRRSLGPL